MKTNSKIKKIAELKAKKIGKGHKDNSIGVDEAGRGPLAGPVVACAVYGPSLSKLKNASLKEEIKDRKTFDSKKISPSERERIFNLIKKSKEFKWGVGVVSEKTIDKINILEATKAAMEKAVGNLNKKIDGGLKNVLIDGKIKLNIKNKQKSIIKGDEKILIIGFASIIAKVKRDKIMIKFSKKYPQYGFEKHKGYGTKFHFEMIKKYGLSPIHRKSFNLFIDQKNKKI